MGEVLPAGVVLNESPAVSIPVSVGDEDRRWVICRGCVNFRDLGGYPTRTGGVLKSGKLYRSDSLHRLTTDDVAHLRTELRIAHIVDLRSTAELRADGRGLLAHEPIRFYHLPLYDGEAGTRAALVGHHDLSDLYFLMAETAMPQISRILATLAESTGPTIYHCTAGKDRTGVISALVLNLLDVDDEVVIRDYTLSQKRLDQIIPRLLADEGYRQMLEALPPDTLHAKPETMRGFLARLRARHGSIHEFAIAAGVSEHTIEQLREFLL